MFNVPIILPDYQNFHHHGSGSGDHNQNSTFEIVNIAFITRESPDFSDGANEPGATRIKFNIQHFRNNKQSDQNHHLIPNVS